jgi:hypothetical protein
VAKSKAVRAVPKPNYSNLRDRTYDIASRFLTALSAIEVVQQSLLDNNAEGMNAQLAATLGLALNHMGGAHEALDRLSVELAQGSASTPEVRL